MISPKPSMALISSREASITAFMVPKRPASSFAAFWPIWRMPREKSTRSNPASLDFSSAARRFSADFSPIRSSAATASGSRW